MEISFIIKKTFQKTQKPIQADKSWVTTITFFVSSDKFLYFEKVFLFLQSLFFLTAPHSLSKTSTDMVESKSNMIFHKLTIKQTHFYLVYTFIVFKRLLEFVVSYFIHKDTESCLDTLFGNILKETRFFLIFIHSNLHQNILVAKQM